VGVFLSFMGRLFFDGHEQDFLQGETEGGVPELCSKYLRMKG